eukprot:gene19986-25956_t
MKNLTSNNIDDNDNVESTEEVNVLLVSIRSIHSNSIDHEVVVARNPTWGRFIILSDVKLSDRLIISTSNGGTVNISINTLIEKAEVDKEFDIPVQSVALASSIKLSISPIKSLNNSSNSKIDILSTLSEYLTTNRKNTITLILSIMFLVISCSSWYSITSDSLLMFLLAAILSTHSIYNIITDSNQNKKSIQVVSSNYRLILLSHAFTSPDVPVNQPEDDIPMRFINGCDGDMKEARRRWDITKRWRETEGVNKILEEPQPNYFNIRKWYPHYHAGRGRDGHVVFYERAGELQYDQYQWQILCGGDDMAKSISVIDIGNVKMSDVAGDQLEYLKKTAAIANHHYPERSYVIYVVNAPVWFSFLWRIIKPLVHENTQKKIRILSRAGTLVGLQEHIDISNIPSYYGGQLDYATIGPPGNPGDKPIIENDNSNESLRSIDDSFNGDTTHTIQNHIPHSNVFVSLDYKIDSKVDGKADSKIDSKLDSRADSKVDNKADSKIDNHIDTKTDKGITSTPAITSPISSQSISPLTPESAFITTSSIPANKSANRNTPKLTTK